MTPGLLHCLGGTGQADVGFQRGGQWQAGESLYNCHSCHIHDAFLSSFND